MTEPNVVAPIDTDRFLDRMVAMEGSEHLPYRDSKGIQSIGIGHNLSVPISDGVIEAIFWNDVSRAEASLDHYLPFWRSLDTVRREIMVELMFNMGWGDGKRGLSTFTRTLAAIKAGDYERAAAGLASSKWAKDVGPRRSDALVKAMRDGVWS